MAFFFCCTWVLSAGRTHHLALAPQTTSSLKLLQDPWHSDVVIWNPNMHDRYIIYNVPTGFNYRWVDLVIKSTHLWLNPVRHQDITIMYKLSCSHLRDTAQEGRSLSTTHLMSEPKRWHLLWNEPETNSHFAVELPESTVATSHTHTLVINSVTTLWCSSALKTHTHCNSLPALVSDHWLFTTFHASWDTE